MRNWIEHLAPPKQLLLAWQAPDHFNERFRWAVGRLIRRDSTLDLSYLSDGGQFASLNQGRTFQQLLRLGYRGYPGFRLGAYHESALPSLMRRLPPRNRPDFKDFKSQFRIPENLRVSDIELLALTEAKLPGDGFSVVDPLDSDADTLDLFLEIAGFRYYVKDKPLGGHVGQPVSIVPEPDNVYDPNAIKVCVEERKIGNINRLQAPAFGEWLRAQSVSACIERLNGNTDKPRAFIFVRVRPRINVPLHPRTMR